jgi:hypothetical protein
MRSRIGSVQLLSCVWFEKDWLLNDIWILNKLPPCRCITGFLIPSLPLLPSYGKWRSTALSEGKFLITCPTFLSPGEQLSGAPRLEPAPPK